MTLWEKCMKAEIDAFENELQEYWKNRTSPSCFSHVDCAKCKDGKCERQKDCFFEILKQEAIRVKKPQNLENFENVCLEYYTDFKEGYIKSDWANFAKTGTCTCIGCSSCPFEKRCKEIDNNFISNSKLKMKLLNEQTS